MGMQVGKQGGVKTDINVTPLIDVVLVLLIIFLVTMPIMMRTVSLTVPRKIDEQHEMTEQKSITITLKADSSVEIDNQERVVTGQITDIATNLHELLKGKEDKLVFVDFDDAVRWEMVVTVMDTVRSVADKAQGYNDVKVALKVRNKEEQTGAVP